MALTQVSTNSIKDATIATADIADDAITADKLANSINTEISANTAKTTNATHTGEVTGSGALTIANDAVTTVKIADSNITTAKIAGDAVTEAKIADNAVTTVQIANDAVTTAKIADSNITTAKIASDAITEPKIADNAVTTAQILDDAVTADKLADAINTSIAGKAVLTGSTNNTITTVTGANAIQGEANLTYDGTTLNVGTGSGTTASAGYDEFVIQGGDADIGMNFLSPAANDKKQQISFGDSNNNQSGRIVYDHDGDHLTFGTNGTAERLRIESGGNVKINDGNLILGTSGKGIDFSANSDGPGTSESELFHTYEEGYWIPTFGNNFTVEANYKWFQYTRVGRLVTVRGYVYPASWSGSDAIYITLPFASLNDAGAANSGAGGCMFRYLDGCTGGLASYVGDNASAMYFYRCESGNSNYSALTTGNLQTGALWYVSHTYATA